MIIKLAALLLIFTIPVEAGPKHWIAHHKRILLVEGAAFGAAAIHYKGLDRCRRMNGPEPCDEHYGAAWAVFGFVTVVNVVAMPAVAEGCWKDGHGKFCNIFAYGGSAAQAGWGLHEATIRRKHEEVNFAFAVRR